MYKKMIMWIRFFFGFSRTEANGFVVLSLLMILFLLAPFYTKQLFFTYTNTQINDRESTLLDKILLQLDEAVSVETPAASLLAFDLNTISAIELETYGIPQYLAKRIVKYRSQVKPFSEKSELLKIYGLDSAIYQKLYPYLLIFNKQAKAIQKQNANDNKQFNDYENKQHYSSYENKKFEPIQPFDLNKADTSQLKKIYGIGPAYAKRIVAYRELLGGFVNLNQLQEVYGLKTPTLDSLQAYTFIKSMANLIQLPLNQLTVQELSKHPYISYKQAKLIVAYRMQHGNYLKGYDLLQIGVFDSVFVEKISPYLHFKE